MSRIYVPLDIETTGLDSNQDAILEISWAVLDDQFEVIVDPHSYLVDHESGWGNVWHRLRQAPQVVRDMHNASGLAGAIVTPQATPMADIADALKRSIWVAKNNTPGSGHTAHLLGMSIAFDIEFLKSEPEFSPLFNDNEYGGIHHRSMDLTGIKLMYESLGWTVPEVENKNPHRALSDVWEAIDMARALKHNLDGREF